MFLIARILILAIIFFGTVWLVLYVSIYLDKIKKEAIEESEEKEKDTSTFKWLMDKIRIKPRSIISRLVKLGTVVLVGIIVFLITHRLYWGVVLGMGGFFIPGMIARTIHKRFMDKFDKQFIDGLNLITNAMRAGSSFPQALEFMVAEMKEPLSEIFGETLREFKLGVSMGEALENTTKRVPSKELRMAITSINIARETGGNLGEILSRITFTMRERNKLKGKVNSLTAQGKMSGMIVAAAPFLMMAVMSLIAPEMMAPLFNTLPGYIMVTMIIIMVAMGWVVILKIINIEI